MPEIEIVMNEACREAVQGAEGADDPFVQAVLDSLRKWAEFFKTRGGTELEMPNILVRQPVVETLLKAEGQPTFWLNAMADLSPRKIVLVRVEDLYFSSAVDPSNAKFVRSVLANTIRKAIRVLLAAQAKDGLYIGVNIPAYGFGSARATYSQEEDGDEEENEG